MAVSFEVIKTTETLTPCATWTSTRNGTDRLMDISITTRLDQPQGRFSENATIVLFNGKKNSISVKQSCLICLVMPLE